MKTIAKFTFNPLTIIVASILSPKLYSSGERIKASNFQSPTRNTAKTGNRGKEVREKAALRNKAKISTTLSINNRSYETNLATREDPARKTRELSAKSRRKLTVS